MSAVKHTPAPWAYQPREGEHESTVYAVPDGRPGRPLVVWAMAERSSTEERDANGKLIAAAPALADALEAQRCYQCTAAEPDEDVCDACRLRRAALRAAGRLP